MPPWFSTEPRKEAIRVKRLAILVCMVSFIILVGIATFFTARHLAYARVEELTQTHACEFAAVVQEISTDPYGQFTEEPVEYYKVFRYAPEYAKLFIVVRFKDGNRNGIYVHLERELGDWRIIQSELVWARYGSADGWTWPPYW